MLAYACTHRWMSITQINSKPFQPVVATLRQYASFTDHYQHIKWRRGVSDRPKFILLPINYKFFHRFLIEHYTKVTTFAGEKSFVYTFISSEDSQSSKHFPDGGTPPPSHHSTEPPVWLLSNNVLGSTSCLIHLITHFSSPNPSFSFVRFHIRVSDMCIIPDIADNVRLWSETLGKVRDKSQELLKCMISFYGLGVCPI